MSTFRRLHRKSRMGCAECKRQHIKCGEEKPRCAYCQRRNATCVYLPVPARKNILTDRQRLPSSAMPRHQLPPTSTSPWNSNLASHGPDNYTCSGVLLLDAEDLALFHHWCVSTSLGIFQDPWIDSVWQKAVPQISFRHAFVVHSMLGLAAMDLAASCTSHRPIYLIRAAQHHVKAITNFRNTLSDISAENCHAVFATAIMNVLHMFTTWRKPCCDGFHGLDPEQWQFLSFDWITLVKGIGIVLQPAWETVRNGPMGPLFTLDESKESDSLNLPLESAALSGLRRIWTTQRDAEIYEKVLHELECSLAPKAGMRFWDRPFKWLHRVSEEYLDRLKQHQPPALVLFAYFGALFHRLDGLWWARGCGKDIVDEVTRALGPYWAEHLEYPREMVGLNTGSVMFPLTHKTWV